MLLDLASLAPGDRLAGLAGRAARHLFLDRQADFWLRAIDPLWSLAEPRARIVAVTRETPDTKTFRLRPARDLGGWRAGQHVAVAAEIDGRRVRRWYSISSVPGVGRDLAITVTRVAGGRMSGWLHEHARVGDCVVLDRPAGAFVLPDPLPRALLFVSGGSGITPIMPMLETLVRGRQPIDAVLLHYAPDARHLIFVRRLAALAGSAPGLRVRVGLTRAATERASERPDRGARRRARAGVELVPACRRLDAAELARLVPDFAARATFVCGPARLMDALDAIRARQAPAWPLARERFTAARAAIPAQGVVAGELALARSGLRVHASSDRSLLEQIEAAGGQPAYGCRAGICGTCACRTLAGTVRNLVTGAISDEAGAAIRLCVSAPVGPVTLDL